jgi:hypothetical protein
MYAPAETVAAFVAPEFWKALSEEVHGLRETLDGSEDEGPDDSSDQIPEQSATDTASACALLFQQAEINIIDRVSQVALEVRMKLLETFRSRVDSVYKILHWPSVISRIQLSNDSPDEVSSMPSLKVLEISIYFMAICSITDDEARMMGLGARLEVLQIYRSTVEALLAKSKLLTNPHLTELQAFVIYLVC